MSRCVRQHGLDRRIRAPFTMGARDTFEVFPPNQCWVTDRKSATEETCVSGSLQLYLVKPTAWAAMLLDGWFDTECHWTSTVGMIHATRYKW